eukprot:SAG22_NODE_16031_length_334_cov_0.863830_1_plen_55_part_10
MPCSAHIEAVRLCLAAPEHHLVALVPDTARRRLVGLVAQAGQLAVDQVVLVIHRL